MAAAVRAVLRFASSILITHNFMANKLIIDKETNERVYILACDCGEQGGEVRFPEDHGCESDDVLEAECDALYLHVCEQCPANPASPHYRHA